MIKKNLSFILFSNGMGGAEQVVMQLIKHIDHTKFNVYLITNTEMLTYFNGLLDQENIFNIGSLYNYSSNHFLNRILNKIVRTLDLQKYLIKLKLKNILKFIDKNKISILHAHLMYDLYAGQLIKEKLNQINFIYTIHGFLNLDNNLKLKYALTHEEFKDYLTNVDYTTCVSELLQTKVIQTLPAIKQKCIYISNALEKINFEKISQFDMKNKKINLLFMGGEKEVKGGILLIKAIEYLIQTHTTTNFILTILGPINKNNTFYKMLKNNIIIEKYIEIVGFVNPPEHLDYIKQSDVLILPSKSEGMPIVLYEGMKLKSALLVSDIPIFKSLLEDQVSALFFSLNIESLATSLNKIISDTQLRNTIVKYNTKQKIPYWDEIIKEYENIYIQRNNNIDE